MLCRVMAGTDTDLSQSIEQLSGVDWGQPEASATLMIKRCFALVKKPLNRLGNDEIRLAVSQKIGDPFIIDLAMARLEADPLLDAEHYPGDLLAALVRAGDDFWKERTGLRERLSTHYNYALQQPLDITGTFRESLGLSLHFGDPN